MPEALAAALSAPGLVWLVLTFLIAGVVRGFTGFGTGLIFMPVAARFIPLADAIVVLNVTGILSLLVLMPRAWREADRGQVGVLALAALATAPLGVMLLTWLDGGTVRWALSLAALVTLVALMAGWRHARRLGWPGLGAVGGAAGVLGGMTGLSGPPVILFYLSGPGRVAQVRANTVLFLSVLDAGIIANLFARGLVGMHAIGLGLLLSVPYLVSVFIGQALFRPERERAYRHAAYAVIGLAIATGLPLFD
ncbi:TSUP family transporter [Actibacterium sp. XHP0104]|uniref:TSUP family transporter n=1 Tax=Actibacterium sp. XHP0104 TaxID=2984335 RepID=UPI0021E9A989|nr:TSUP family transporter [Actibacterium sp. XHP0104]MCV2880910.1 TSUP family transporter [Actibacterium sp. XHP0104]